ncbi:FAD-dependent oxidoreductase [Streptomyces gamaensis]|uniref:FAD-dependent oxidoreductase n=1 Tax=Streptomyces gamaensis TaxID=1763542 RepID=A0ABW0ZC29_9ACTN
MTRYGHVFRPGSLGTLRLPHRLLMGAMHLNLETLDDGGAALAAFYAERARGGAALIVTGGAAVNRAGAGGPGYALLTDPAHRAALGRAARAVHAAGGRIALQLFHAGRYAPAANALAPSAVYSRFTRGTPREMTSGQIAETLADFAAGARLAQELGFDAVELMGAQGYLLNQFTAPVTNVRDDAWGGDAVRRRRAPVAAVRAVRAAVGDGFPVLFRMSAADLVDGGTPADEAAALAVALADAGADALSVCVGWHESPVPTVQSEVPAGAWLTYARNIGQALRDGGHGSTPVIASHRFTRLAEADEALASGAADFVAMARPFLADPAIVAKSRAGRAATVEQCLACNQACIDRSFGQERVSCLVNPRAGHETEFPLRTVGRTGRYTVIGAGPAGLEAARTLAGFGHHVQLYEAADRPGGQLNLAARVPGKEEFAETVRRRVRQLADLGVELRLGHRVATSDLPSLAASDGVVLATGVLDVRPELPGTPLRHVIGYPHAFTAPETLGRRVAVIGGGAIAVDLARLLTADGTTGREVTLLRRGERIGAGIGPSTRWVALCELRARRVRMLTGVRYREITRDGVRITDAEGTERHIAADTVVLAAGQERELDVSAALRRAGIRFVAAGGAAGTEGLNAARATAEGLRAAYRIAGGAPC